jgi:hypothetical protein
VIGLGACRTKARFALRHANVLRDVGSLAHRKQIEGAGEVLDAPHRQIEEAGVESIHGFRTHHATQ